MFVQCHTDAFATAADGYSRITLAGFYSESQRMGIIGIITTFGRIRAEILVRPSFGIEPLFDVLLEFKSCMVGS